MNAPASVRRLEKLAKDARRIQRKAEKEGDLRCALMAVGQLAKIIEIIAKLSGEELMSRTREVLEPDIKLPEFDVRAIARQILASSPEPDETPST